MDQIIWKFLEAPLSEWMGFLGWTLGLVLLIWSIFWIRAWFQDGEDRATDDHRMLSQFGDLHREGGLSEEEFRSIKRRLVQNLQDDSSKSQRDP